MRLPPNERQLQRRLKVISIDILAFTVWQAGAYWLG